MTLSPHHRVLSGMRPTGAMHLGNYYGALKNWIELQHKYECFFFVADWHALTTHYEYTENVASNVREMLIDWLAVGLNPNSACIFLQSHVPQHAELLLLLSMITPLSWLERVPTYKDQQEKLKEFDLSTYGFLGYPLLQSADILLYKADFVPVGEDQVAHVEVAREIARRFNHIYGSEAGFVAAAEAAINKLGKKNKDLYVQLRKRYQEQGDLQALETAKAMLDTQQNITLGDHERLEGYLVGSGKIILPEPEALLTKESKMPGLDGQKMSKSYKNTINLRDEKLVIEEKIKRMPTDPARVRRSDPGEPTKCPVWNFHQMYSNDEVQQWVLTGCRTAGIGCLECKQPIIDAVEKEIAPIRENAQQYLANPGLIRSIVAEGCENARTIAEKTMEEVRSAMQLDYKETLI